MVIFQGVLFLKIAFLIVLSKSGAKIDPHPRFANLCDKNF
jgi:hypothetical protein